MRRYRRAIENRIAERRWSESLIAAQEIVRSYRIQAPDGFDPQNTSIALIAAIGVAAAATAYSAKSASDSASEANATNQATADSDRALAYKMFLQSKGAEGNALLPMYMPSGTETNLGNQAYATYLAEQAALGTPQDQIKSYQEIVNSMTPAMNAGDTLVNQLFSGELEKQQLQNIQPILTAREGVAKAQKVGIMEGLIARTNALIADRARSGYQGGGSAFQNNLLTSATIPALQAAGTVGAQTDVANAADVASIKNTAINTRLNNLNLPTSQAANRIQMKQMPATATGNAYTTSLQPFNFFKLNQSAFQPQSSPLVSPVANTGQIVAAGVGSGASTLGNYFATRSLINQLNANNTLTGTTAPSSYLDPNFNQQDAQMIDAYGLTG